MKGKLVAGVLALFFFLFEIAQFYIQVNIPKKAQTWQGFPKITPHLVNFNSSSCDFQAYLMFWLSP